jgi:hypothetical protein
MALLAAVCQFHQKHDSNVFNFAAVIVILLQLASCMLAVAPILIHFKKSLIIIIKGIDWVLKLVLLIFHVLVNWGLIGCWHVPTATRLRFGHLVNSI